MDSCRLQPIERKNQKELQNQFVTTRLSEGVLDRTESSEIGCVESGCFEGSTSAGEGSGSQHDSSSKSPQTRTTTKSSHRLSSGDLLWLLSKHPWAGREVVSSVYVAANYQVHKAHRLLSDMCEAEIAGEDMRAPQEGSDLSTDNIYWKYRKEALQAGRQLRKLKRKSSAAWQNGCYSLWRSYSDQAKKLEETCVKLHREAAANIEQNLNQRGLDSSDERTPERLDLHGLDVAEALEAVERRLSALESRSSARAKTRSLHVIVGRGKHSSGGEASIPRAVEGFLTQRGNKSVWISPGAIEVRVRHAKK